jgi:hypothetical protein
MVHPLPKNAKIIGESAKTSVDVQIIAGIHVREQLFVI